MRKSLKHFILSLSLIAFLTFDVFAQIKVYTMNGCGRCAHTVKYLKDNKIAFTELNTTTSEKNNTEMWALLEGKANGSISMPVINNNGEVAFSIKNLDSYLSKMGSNTKTNEPTNTEKGGFVTIFQHSNYEGKNQKLKEGEYNLKDLQIGNDELSSIKIPAGMYAVLYQHSDFDGSYIELAQNESYIGDEFNDQTSSIVVGYLTKEEISEDPADVPDPNHEPTVKTTGFKGCATGTEDVPAENEAFEKKIWELVNIERKKIGKPALVWNANLARAARYHAADMANDDYFDHDSHDVENGVKKKVCSTFERIGKFGSGYAENIAWNSSNSPESVIDQWMNSKGHKANILSDNQAIGVGYYKGYWVQVFGSK